MPVTPPRSCHDTAVPQLGMLPALACVQADNAVCVRSTVPLPTLQSSERQREGQIQLRATSTWLAAFPLMGRQGDCRQEAIVLTGNAQSPAHAICLTGLPAAVIFLHQLNTLPGSPRPRPHTCTRVTPRTTLANSDICLNPCKEPTTKSKTVPCKSPSWFLEGKTSEHYLDEATRLLCLEKAFPPSKALFCILIACINGLYKHNTLFSRVIPATCHKWPQWNLVISNEGTICRITPISKDSVYILFLYGGSS